jgi:hypothetical protein
MFAFSFALASAGNIIEASIPMMAMTTSSSINVKADAGDGLRPGPEDLAPTGVA